MPVEHSNDNVIHINNIFTDLFQALKKFNVDGTHLDYCNNTLHNIMLHTDNATTSLLHGLQAIGKLAAHSSLNNQEDMHHLGYFLTLIANLMEALFVLRSDCEISIDNIDPPIALES